MIKTTVYSKQCLSSTIFTVSLIKKPSFQMMHCNKINTKLLCSFQIHRKGNSVIALKNIDPNYTANGEATDWMLLQKSKSFH